MPAHSHLPGADELVRLRRRHPRESWHPPGCSKGHKLADIGAMYGVTHSAVYYQLRQAGKHEQVRPRYTDTIPWRVANEHRDAWEVTMLRELSKQLAGKPLGNKGPWLEGWLAELDKAREVVDYDPVEGFRRVKRKRGEKGYIRTPPTPG